MPPPEMSDQAGHKFAIQLVNEMVSPLKISGAHTLLSPGQLVWAKEHMVEETGCATIK